MKVIGENEVKIQLKSSTGPMGPAGADGKDGTSVTHSWRGTTLTVTSASGTSSADLKGEKGEPGKDGKDGATGLVGPAGADGKDGAPGADGEDGGYYSPSVDAEGNLTWMPSKTGMPGVAGANIRGPEGPKGEAGQDGATGPEGQKGATGPSGADGKDGGYYTPAVDNDGNLTWTASKADMPDVPGVNIKGPAGSIDNLPIASAGTLGGVMPVAKTDEMTQAVGVDAEGKLFTAAGAGGGETVVRSEETLAEGIIPVDTPIYSFTNTGLTFQEILKTWKIFYIQTYTTGKNRMNIHGSTSNDQPIFHGAENWFYQCIVFFSLGKEFNTVMWKRYGSNYTGDFWDKYSPAGYSDLCINIDMETIRDISPSVGLFLRNYGAAATAEIKWKVSGLIKWSNVQ